MERLSLYWDRTKFSKNTLLNTNQRIRSSLFPWLLNTLSISKSIQQSGRSNRTTSRSTVYGKRMSQGKDNYEYSEFIQLSLNSTPT